MSRKLKREQNVLYPELGYVEIGLTHGRYAKVSWIDYPELSKHKWSLHRSLQKRVVRHEGRSTFYMHHDVIQLMGLKLEYPQNETDHINQDTLDNRRENLRLVTHSENMKNTVRHKERLGFMLHKASGLWFAYVNYPCHRVVSLGYWRTRERAEEIAKMGRELQASCTTSSVFKEEWKKIAPRKKFDRGEM